MIYRFLILIDTFFKPFYFILNRLKWSAAIPDEPSHFVVLKLFGLGSITRIFHVMNTVGIRAHEVTFITLHQNKVIIDLLGLNAIYIKTTHPLAVLSSIFRVVFQTWNQKQASILDMERNSNLAGIFRLLIGIGKTCNSFYFKAKNKKTRGQSFISLKNKPATHAIAEMFNSTYIEPIDKEYIAKTSNKILVNINAGNYISERKFTPSKYAALLKTLHNKNPNWHFYLTGVKSEYKYVESFKERLTNLGVPSIQIFNIAGQHNLAEFVAFLDEAKVFITNDSGPLHLAYIYGVKTVGIWGPTSSRLVGYKDNNLMLNCNTEMCCAPCFIHPKSQIAKSCNGEITCFKTRDLKAIASKIIRFIELEKDKELIA